MSYFELSKRTSKGGRRKIKMSLLEIHQNENDVNKNGLHWNEQYVLNNLDSAKGIPICAEFIDEDKRVPLDHGFTEIDSEENEPLFENSEVVGTIETAYPLNVEINGVHKRILCGEGYIYQQRYPNFVKWLAENVPSGNVRSSIEIMGTPENDNKIVYENDDDSKEKRSPAVFSFSGTAILSVEAADDSAIILQMNSLNTPKNKGSEEKEMDEKTISLIADAVKSAVTETNSKNAEYESKISELNAIVAEKDNKIVELNASVEQIQKALDDLKAEHDTYWAERDLLEKELAQLKVNQRLAEMNSAIEIFSDEQKALAQAEIDIFKADPINVEINSITDKIYRELGKQSVENAKTTQTGCVPSINDNDILSEVNSVTAVSTETVDIFAPIY